MKGLLSKKQKSAALSNQLLTPDRILFRQCLSTNFESWI
jgi:hypothetical protein